MAPIGPDLAIATEGLTKRFGDRAAVDHVDLRVPRASVTGFVGPNGAGKTTTLRMLLGLVRPSSGSATVLGRPLTKPSAYLGQVGALIESPAFYPTMTGRANLETLARLGGISTADLDDRLAQVGLADRGGDQFRRYSLGMKQRLGIAAALLPDPELLILDEPANGLDPAGMIEVRQLLRTLAARGTTVLISSHLLAEIEQICDHVVMIAGGKVLFQGAMDALLDGQRDDLIAQPEHGSDLAGLVALVRAAGYEVTVADDREVRISGAADWAAELNRQAFAAGITLARLAQDRGNLEEAFLDLVRAPAEGPDLGAGG